MIPASTCKWHRVPVPQRSPRHPPGRLALPGRRGKQPSQPAGIAVLHPPGQLGQSTRGQGEPLAAGKGPEHPGQSNILALQHAAV